MNYKHITESKDYFGKIIKFREEGTDKLLTGVIVDPDIVDEIDTDECHGPHITDEWYGGCVNKAGKNFDQDNPPYYIVATGSWETSPTPGDFHYVPADQVDLQVRIKQSLSPNTLKTFEELIDEL